MKKNNSVVFGLTSNHVFAVACVMMDLKRFCKSIIDEIVIFHDGINEKDKRLLTTIMPCRFIIYDFPLKNTSNFDQTTLNYFSKMVFSKFECFRLLDDYCNVVWLDYDIVIQQDISELFEPSKSGIQMIRSGTIVRDQLSADVDDYDMTALGITASTFSVHQNLPNYRDKYAFCYKILPKYAQYLRLPEQAIIDFMLQEFENPIETLDVNIYSPHPKDLLHTPSAKIVHAYGQPKFWNGINNIQWNRNYTAWIEMGGTKYRELNIAEKIFRKLKRLILNRSKSN